MNNLSVNLIISLVACLVIAGICLYLTRRRLSDIEKKADHEMHNLRHEMNTKITALELAAYEKISGTEHEIYDSSHRDTKNDFSGKGAQVWDYVDHRFSNGSGTGSYNIKGNEITLYRTNNKGRYELYLNHYSFGRIVNEIPADNSIQFRHLRLSFEAKKNSAPHILRFVFKGKVTNNALDEKDYVVYNPEWEKVNLVFTIPANEPCFLRIDDIQSEEEQNTIQLRNITLYEKIDAKP